MSPDRRKGHGPKQRAGGAAPPTPSTSSTHGLPAAPPFEDTEFLRLPLPGELVQGAAEAGYRKMTPLQERLIPLVLDGKDVLVRTRAGSGKTTAYLLPALAKVKTPGQPQVVVLVATRETADLVAREAKRLAAHYPVAQIACLDGTRKGSAEEDELARGPTVIVAVPERIARVAALFEQAEQANAILFFDEADFLFGKRTEVKDAHDRLAAFVRQTVVLCDRLTPEVEAFVAAHMPGAVRVEVDGVAAGGETAQPVYDVAAPAKLDLLVALLARDKPERSVVLVRDKFVSDRVVERLKSLARGARAYHSGIPEPKRPRIVKEFNAGRFTYLVATDAAAKSLEPERVRHVVNYDVPASADDYLRRLAWTAPMGKAGVVATLVTPDQATLWASILAATGAKVMTATVPGFDGGAAPRPERPPRRPNGGKDADRESWRPTWAGASKRGAKGSKPAGGKKGSGGR